MSRLTTPRQLAGLLGIGALFALGSAQSDQALAAAQADMDTVTVRVDPSYQGQIFEGWGTSLGWFANATGDYPDEIRERLADMVFGDDGLALNIARYNIGGGNAPDIRDYLRPGGAVEGWWDAPDGIARGDVDWWDPADPRHWNADADKTQRWWIDRIKAGIDKWEAFSNSPPWFMTVSGYVSGGFDADEDQLRTERIDDFAAYLVGVVERLEAAHGIEFHTIEPFNEPNTLYWSTRLDDDGEPAARQEGAHMGPALQQAVIRSLAAELDQAATGAVIAAMDETNPGTFIRNWSSYAADVRDHVGQLNVHTYGTESRTAVRDIAKGEHKRLWMSEVEGSFGEGRDFESMGPGLGIARRIVDDMRELEPSAWVFWQPVEDYDNMAPRGGSAGGNWGSIQIRFDCTTRDTLDTCRIYTNTKYDAIRNFTHHIRPGDRFVKVDDVASVAAISGSGRAAIVVHINGSDRGRSVTLDLSAFGSVEPTATVTPVVTSADGALITGEPAPVEGHGATLTVPARSVTTFLVDGVAGVAPDASLVREGHLYRLGGVLSGGSLGLSADAETPVIHATGPIDDGLSWHLRKLTSGDGNRERYAISHAATGRQLAVRDGHVVLEEPRRAARLPAQWIMSTTGDGSWTFVNVATRKLLAATGQATAGGTPVSVELPDSGESQRWTVIDETGQRRAVSFVEDRRSSPGALTLLVVPAGHESTGLRNGLAHAPSLETAVVAQPRRSFP